MVSLLNIYLHMNKILCALLCLATLILGAPRAFAGEPIRLFEWAPEGQTAAPLIIPVKAGETPEQAAQRYLSNLEKNTDMMELFQGHAPELRIENFKPFIADRETSSLLLANQAKDYGMNSGRINNVIRLLSHQETPLKAFILPVSWDLGLSQEEARSALRQISDRFSMLTPLGGDDVANELYKSENYHSRNTNRTRDLSESKVINFYVREKKGFLFSFCRGTQLTSVTLGYKLIQDLPIQVGPEMQHSDSWHEIEVKKTSNNVLGQVLTTGSATIRVNSFHHQSVIFHPGGPLEVAAVAPDGVIEALELKDGHGLLTQFHPELMENDLGLKIIRAAITQKNKVMVRSCSKVFQL